MKKIAIIGAGILGISTGIELLKSGKSLHVTIFEKERRVSSHASGRNSGVIHAGFYYSPDSLKAKFCRTGNRELRQLCKKNQIPILETGKVVVARNDEEVGELEKLFDRGIKNGVELELLEEKQLSAFEPLARTYEKFMWSPNTAVSSPNLISTVLIEEFLKLGGKLVLGKSIQLQKSNGGISIKGDQVHYAHVINCAGTYSNKLALQVGLADDYLAVPFLGSYLAANQTSLPLRTLIYPVPHPVNPFLGTHFTITAEGMVKIGPSAIPALGRENYKFLQGIKLGELPEISKGFLAILKGDKNDLIAISRQEIPKLSHRFLLRSALPLLSPDVKVEKSAWTRKPPGIRAQLVAKSNGQLVQDFIVESLDNSTHVLNLVSPGWTCAIPFAKWLTSEKILPNLE
jgi:L-2-hydroxyglutarate oxidase LhgO